MRLTFSNYSPTSLGSESLHGCLLVVVCKVWVSTVLQKDSCNIDVVLGGSIQPIELKKDCGSKYLEPARCAKAGYRLHICFLYQSELENFSIQWRSS